MELLIARRGEQARSLRSSLYLSGGAHPLESVGDFSRYQPQRAVCIRTLATEAALIKRRISALAGEKGNRGNLSPHFPRPEANSVTVKASRRCPGKSVGWVFSEEIRVRRNGENRIRLSTRAFKFLWIALWGCLLLNYLCVYYISHLSWSFHRCLPLSR